MNLAKRMIGYVICCVLGIVLLVLGCTNTADNFWSGMGASLVAVCFLRLVQMYRLRKNQAYREKVQTEVTDERNRFLRCKAWAWAGYIFVLIAATATVVLRALGQSQLSLAAGCAVFLLAVLHWIAYAILRKKY